MTNKQLLDIIKIQAQIIKVLSREYKANKINPIEKEIIEKLLDELNESLQ